MLNTFLADQIVDNIERHPEKHDQSNWGIQTDCGTTMCVAGWACHLSGAQLVYDFKQTNGEVRAFDCVLPNGERRSIEEYATELLGVDEDQANALFYNMTNDLDTIKRVFKDIANGGDGYAGM